MALFGLLRLLVIVPLALTLFALGSCAGRESVSVAASPSPGMLLDGAISNFQGGNLEAAWNDFRAFFSHPGNADVEVDAYLRCFGYNLCPEFGVLGFILGKGIADAGDFQAFCPDWENSFDPEIYLERADEFLQLRNILIGRALGSCSEWTQRNAFALQGPPREERPPSQTLVLLSRRQSADAAERAGLLGADPTPRTTIRALGGQLIAWVDTGATLNLFSRLVAANSPHSVETYGDVFTYVLTGSEVMTLARIDEIRLAAFSLRHQLAMLSDRYRKGGRELVFPEVGNILGMGLLLQYGSVCFDWSANLLHLGELGPCKAGLPPRRAWLSGSLSLFLEVSAKGLGAMPALVDTGLDETFCSKLFLESNDGIGAFSFGLDPSMSGQCRYNPRVRFNDAEVEDEQVTPQVKLGMDVLGNFAAFGWQLNPLRVYFVPKPDDQAPAVSSL